jgi:hypothetical protein
MKKKNPSTSEMLSQVHCTTGDIEVTCAVKGRYSRLEREHNPNKLNTTWVRRPGNEKKMDVWIVMAPLSKYDKSTLLYFSFQGFPSFFFAESPSCATSNRFGELWAEDQCFLHLLCLYVLACYPAALEFCCVDTSSTIPQWKPWLYPSPLQHVSSYSSI